MKIIIGNDHAGVEFKNTIMKHLEEQGHEVVNVGTDTLDYPDIAKSVAEKVLAEEGNLGIIICGTGIGISIAANKVEGIRAALCHNEFTARMARLHNNANIVALGARVIGDELGKAIVDTFITTEFSNEERHIKRIEKITNYENQLK